MDLKLTGKYALVTGSTSGIGAGVAEGLAREGVVVVIHGRSAERSATVADRIRDAGGSAHVALGDLETDAGAKAVIDQALQAVPQIDILVNNIGGPVEGRLSFFDTTVDEWIDSYNSNAVAGIRMIHQLVPAMRDRGWGRVIQISSRNSISPHNNMPSYGAAKAATNNFSLGLSKELAFTGVTSNAIMPGLIYTQQLDTFLENIANRQMEGDIEKAKDFVLKNICRQTVSRLGIVEDIAHYVCFLASPNADFITGTVLRIDGGSTPTV